MSPNSNLIAESQKINPSSVIELYKLELNAKQHGVAATYTFHDGRSILNNGSADIVWTGITFLAFPVKVDGYEYQGNGQLPQPKLKVANVNGMITELLKTIRVLNPGNDLIGAKLTRIRTFGRFLDAVNFEGGVNPNADPTAEWPREIYYIIQKSAETRDLVEFTLASAFDLQGVRAPKRQCLSNICSWAYRSSECGYTANRYYKENNELTSLAEEDECGKTLDSCRKRFGQVETVGMVTAGSLIVTGINSASITQISQGDSIVGFGLPTNTTVTSVNISNLSLTVSRASVSTNDVNSSGGYVQREGILVDGGLRIRTPEAGFTANQVVAGMSVTGPFLPTDRTVTIESVTFGNDGYYYLKLAIPFNTGIYGSLRGNREGAYITSTGGIEWQLNQRIDTLAAGDYIVYDKATIGTKVLTVTLSKTGVSPDRGLLASAGTYIGPISIYAPAVPTTSTYSFSGQRIYLIKTGGALPFGGFPGLSSYITA
jgi:lambda family phage minor tail protein L